MMRQMAAPNHTADRDARCTAPRQMNVVDVPTVNGLPGDLLGDIPKSLAFLLTCLLTTEEGLLHAECRHGCDQDVTWYLRPRTDGNDHDDVPVAALPPGVFSSLVARIALTAGIDHQKGGTAPLALSQNGRHFDCRVFLSKCRESGYWIRLYARAVCPRNGTNRPGGTVLLIRKRGWRRAGHTAPVRYPALGRDHEGGRSMSAGKAGRRSLCCRRLGGDVQECQDAQQEGERLHQRSVSHASAHA